MATIKRFEDLDIWQLARKQCQDCIILCNEGSLSKDFELKNQMGASSGSVMDCIAEGFDRSGNSEFKNFLLMAKGSNSEFRSQLFRCFDKKHFLKQRLDELMEKNITLGNKIMAFVTYLQKSEFKGQRFK